MCVMCMYVCVRVVLSGVFPFEVVVPDFSFTNEIEAETSLRHGLALLVGDSTELLFFSPLPSSAIQEHIFCLIASPRLSTFEFRYRHRTVSFSFPFHSQSSALPE